MIEATQPEISLIFPVWNEVENIGPALDAAVSLAPKLADSFEIIVVDDGSQDGSSESIEAHRRGDERIRVVRHASNQGYGAALRSGLAHARGRLVFFTDADLQFDLRELASLLEHTRRFDIVAGFRAPRRDPWHRRAIAASWNFLVRQLFDLDVRDIDCAFKVFRREVIEAIELESIGAFVNTEILVRARHAGFRIHQLPVTHHPRRHGRQSGARPRVVWRAMVELATLYRRLRTPAEIPARAQAPSRAS